MEWIHAARGRCDAIVINPGAFTHYAWSLHDAARRPSMVPWSSCTSPTPTGASRGGAPASSPPSPPAPSPGFGGHGYELAIRAVAAALTPLTGSDRSPLFTALDTEPDRRPARSGRLRLPASLGASARALGRPRTMVVSNPSNIRWLTGFGGSLGWVVVAPPARLPR